MEKLIELVLLEVDSADKKHGKCGSVPSLSAMAEKRSDPDRRAQLYMIPSDHMAKTTTEVREKDGTTAWADFMVEEVSETICAKDDATRRNELIQVAATALRWIRKIDEDVEKAANKKKA